jgi:hypothetical protein
MNRVYPLREGSGECRALKKLDVEGPSEFRLPDEKYLSRS